MCLDVACAEILVCTSHFCLLLNRVFLLIVEQGIFAYC